MANVKQYEYNSDTHMPSHYEIFDYWKDYAICRDGSIIPIKDWRQHEDCEFVIMDWGEPECFCCGTNLPQDFWLSDWYKEAIEKGDLKTIWNGTRGYFERAHVLSRQGNGPNVPSNLFLLCPYCHKESPDTDDLVAFFRWIYKNKNRTRVGPWWTDEFRRELVEEVEARNLDLGSFDINKMKAAVFTHGFEESKSSFMAAYLSCMDKKA